MYGPSYQGELLKLPAVLLPLTNPCKLLVFACGLSARALPGQNLSLWPVAHAVVSCCFFHRGACGSKGSSLSAHQAFFNREEGHGLCMMHAHCLHWEGRCCDLAPWTAPKPQLPKGLQGTQYSDAAVGYGHAASCGDSTCCGDINRGQNGDFSAFSGIWPRTCLRLCHAHHMSSWHSKDCTLSCLTGYKLIQ